MPLSFVPLYLFTFKSFPMDPTIFVAEPDKDYSTFIILLLVTLICGGFAFAAQKRKLSVKGNWRQLGVLLGGLFGLVFLTTTLFSGWEIFRIQPVVLKEDHLICYGGKIPYKSIRRAGIYTDKQNSFINPQITLRQDKILVIETTQPKTFLFSDDHFDVEMLVRKIREKMEED